MIKKFRNVKEEAGQTMAEYAVVLGVISAVIIATLTLLSTRINSVLTTITGAL